MRIRFLSNRTLYVIPYGGRSHTLMVFTDREYEVEITAYHADPGLMDLTFPDRSVARGCPPDWYEVIEGATVATRLAYVSKMDRLPLP